MRHVYFISNAAQRGNVKVMDWLLQQPGTVLSRDVMSMAAWKGHAALCQYLYAQQCPWDDTRHAMLLLLADTLSFCAVYKIYSSIVAAATVAAAAAAAAVQQLLSITDYLSC
eukprot:12107-Heterococcus_DN1.PRE.2